mmetsp:Transcript_6544/g.18254  ORF Transcript_6544/g.18254 Transcript_6544/m.18254 type:complete len:185 (+) Transcript_6544:200-754(+)
MSHVEALRPHAMFAQPRSCGGRSGFHPHRKGARKAAALVSRGNPSARVYRNTKWGITGHRSLLKHYSSANRLARPNGRRSLAVLAAESREVMAVWPAFKNLQSVHDIRGVAIKVNEDEPVTISEGRAFYVGAAFADWMAENVDFTDSGGMRVAVSPESCFEMPELHLLLAAAPLSSVRVFQARG